MIDKSLGGDVSDLPELHMLLKSMVDAGYVAFDLGVGPTDYMTADNKDEVMGHPEFQAMASMFHQVTFNAAFLEKDLDKYTEMCHEIDIAVPGKPIRFLIPAAPYFFRTDKFGNMIGDKLTHIKNTMQSAYLNEAGFVVNCTHDTVDDSFEEMLRVGFDVEFPVDKDDILNIPYGRAPNKGLLVGEQIKRMSYRITQYYSGLEGEDERRRNPDLHYDTGTMVNLLYTGGKLYWVPFLKDDCPFLEDEFTIPKPWTMDNLLSVRQKALDASLEYLKDTGCMTCPYLSSCAEKGITSIMRYMSIKECLVGLEYVQ